MACSRPFCSTDMHGTIGSMQLSQSTVVDDLFRLTEAAFERGNPQTFQAACVATGTRLRPILAGNSAVWTFG